MSTKDKVTGVIKFTETGMVVFGKEEFEALYHISNEPIKPKVSKTAIAIKLNTQQPVLRDDIWWQAFDMVMGAMP